MRHDGEGWVYGYIVNEDYILQYLDSAESWEPLTSDHKIVCRAYEVDTQKIGEWTTQVDAKETKIFEGDILEGHSDGLVYVKWVEDCWECIFDDGGNITLAEMNRWFGKARVIGNIHENPELCGL